MCCHFGQIISLFTIHHIAATKFHRGLVIALSLKKLANWGQLSTPAIEDVSQ
jgi:hypothetical protein